MENNISLKDALSRVASFCAYRERSIGEVKIKLSQLGLAPEFMDEAIEKLKEEGFLNEERFANYFVQSKLNQNRWGRIKIIAALRQKGVENVIIDKAIDGIDTDIYYEVLTKLIRKKCGALKNLAPQQQYVKVVAYVSSKGFEPALAFEILKKEEEIK